jgi:O-antigen/teichoic acid export membrane protein
MGLGRILGVAEYGRYSLVIGFTTMIILLVSRGIPTAMNKRISENIGKWAIIRSIRTTSGIIQMIVIVTLTSGFYLCAPLFAQIFNDPSLTQLFQISAFIIPAFALSSFHVSYFNGLKFFKAMTVMKVARGIFRIAWIIGLAYTFTLEGAIYGSILAPLSVFITAVIIEKFFLTDHPKMQKASQKYPWKKIVSYAGTFMLFVLFYEFYIRADIYLIKALTGSDVNTGLYNAAVTIALIPYYLMFALTFILFPTMSELAKKKDLATIRTTLSRVTVFLFTILIPAAFVMIFFSDLLVTMFFGQKFIAAGSLIPYMVGGTVFSTIFYVYASVFNGADLNRIPTAITAIAIVGAVSANIHFLPMYGITATAMIFSCTATFMGTASMLAAYRCFFIKSEKV